MTFLLKIRDTAKTNPNEATRAALRDLADQLHAAIVALHYTPTAEALENVNGLWARATRLLKNIEAGGDGGPTGGSLRTGALLQRAA